MTRTADRIIESPACSDADRAAGDDPAGSTPAFDSFLLLDYRSPWSRTAADDAIRDLVPAPVAAAIHARRRLRTFAIRPVGDRRVTPVDRPRFGRVGTAAGMTTLPTLSVASDLPDSTALATAEPGAIHIGVCTNAKRDRCCAVRGRPVALALAREFGPRVTEISHLGGHRFAATMLVLPTGYSYGVLDPGSARRVALAAVEGLVHPSNLRGRSDLEPAAQAVDAFWRARIGRPAPVDSVEITACAASPAADGDDTFLVEAQVEGTRCLAEAVYRPGATITDTACGGKPIRTGHWSIRPR